MASVDPPKVIFFCGERSPYGKAHLAPLLSSKLDIVAVVVATDSRWKVFETALNGVSHRVDPIGTLLNTIKGWRRRGKAPSAFSVPEEMRLLTEENVNSTSFLALLERLSPDLLISAAYPQIFGQPLLSAAPLGAVNFHPSKLPEFRGAHPHYWAIAKGATEGGVTAHYMTTKLDEGDILAQRTFSIEGMGYREHYERIISETPALVHEVADKLMGPNAKESARMQDHNSATVFRQDRQIHHRVFWQLQTAESICNQLRAGYIYCFFRNRRLLPLECRAAESNRNLTNAIPVPPGTIVDFLPDGLVISTARGCVVVSRLRYRGFSMSWRRFSALFRPQIGEIVT